MNILFIMSSYNIYGGTPRKILDLIDHSNNNSFLYVYYKNHQECKNYFDTNCVKILEGYYGKNIYKHIVHLLRFIDENSIHIIQTQFFMGEILGTIIKYFRPQLKVIVTFEGSASAVGIRKFISNIAYKNIDAYIYISKFVKKEKENKFPILKQKESRVIYNGVTKRTKLNTLNINLNHIALVDVASLIELKNTSILVDAMDILINILKRQNIYLYLVGEGDFRQSIEKQIKEKKLTKNIFLLGKQEDIGEILDQCDIFVHPCYMEGFGIAVVEAMLAKKPIIAANSGAHSELIEHNISGLLIDPFNAQKWADAIIDMIEDNQLSKKFASNAMSKASISFSIKNCVKNHEEFYSKLMGKI